MGVQLYKIGNKVTELCYDHPVVASAAYLVAAGALTVGLYKYFGKIVAKEVAKALI